MSKPTYDPVSVSNLSVVYAAVNGFAERRSILTADYDFAVEIFWADGRTTFVKRTYDDFTKLHKELTNFFYGQCQKGLVKVPIFLPKLEGKKLFKWYTRDLAEDREMELHVFLKDLLQGNPMISGNPIVLDFFASRHTDPVPSREPPDGASYEEVSLDDDDGDNDDDDNVIFTR